MDVELVVIVVFVVVDVDVVIVSVVDVEVFVVAVVNLLKWLLVLLMWMLKCFFFNDVEVFCCGF